MKHIIIGTAGHIDHGKTTLIKALTGRNTDRWEEEQRRGITIDLGFTYFDLKNGDRVGIIDVPGHEKFINNMVAGVAGMDLVMLVVAADEGIMPQTREHMDILGQLGVEKSILVLNKCDLVDEEWLELVEEEIREELAGTFLEKAPVVKVSAATGQGIDELVDLVEKMTTEDVEEKDIYTIPRLPIDRVFSLSGFGTVITGTLLSGTLTKDDKLEVFPIGKECKIRNIQVHGMDVDKCYAGQRVAINISNLKKKELHRGCVLAPFNSMKNTKLIDVKLNMLESSMRVITNQTRLHFFSGTSEVLCRAILLDRSEMGPGDSGYVQLRMEEEVALKKGDRFVVRFYSPMETIGGGVVLEPNPEREKRFQNDVIERLQQKESGSSKDVIDLHVKGEGENLITAVELAKKTALSQEEVNVDIEELKEEGTVLVFPMKKDTYVWHTANEMACREKMTTMLDEYQKKYPYRGGLSKANVRAELLKTWKQNVFDEYIERLLADGAIKQQGELLSLPDYEVLKDKTYEAVTGKLRKTLTDAKYDFVRLSEIDFGNVSKEVVDDLVALMVAEGEVAKVADDMFTMKSYVDEAKEKIVEILRANGKITIAEIRDMFNTSRKSAKPILEYMDKIRVTRKTGGESEREAGILD